VTTSGPWLVLDTATPIAIVGVVDGVRVLAEHRLSEPKRHAEGLIDAIDGALLAAGVTLDALGGIGVGRGPGSFIGVRTGIATAKGLALGRSLPLVGLPTLVALAFSAPGIPDGDGLAVIDAKRGEVYAQRVAHAAGEVRGLEEPRAMTPDAARALAASLAFVIGPAAGGIDVATPSAAGLARALAVVTRGGVVDETAALVPDYCRAPDAKLPAVDPSAHRPTTT
jgi:tRNA threonylcarbamoyladenosine biosynthesis protein TsaB